MKLCKEFKSGGKFEAHRPESVANFAAEIDAIARTCAIRRVRAEFYEKNVDQIKSNVLDGKSCCDGKKNFISYSGHLSRQ